MDGHELSRLRLARPFRSLKGPGQGKGQVGNKAGSGPHWSWGKGGFASLAGEREVGIKKGGKAGRTRKDLRWMASPNVCLPKPLFGFGMTGLGPHEG